MIRGLQIHLLQSTNMDQNFTKPLLKIGSMVFKMAGQTIILVASIYLLYIVTLTTKNVLDNMPRIVDRVGENGTEISINENWKSFLEYSIFHGWKTIKILAVLVFGLFLKGVGIALDQEGVSQFLLGVSGGEKKTE